MLELTPPDLEPYRDAFPEQVQFAERRGHWSVYLWCNSEFHVVTTLPNGSLVRYRNVAEHMLEHLYAINPEMTSAEVYPGMAAMIHADACELQAGIETTAALSAAQERAGSAKSTRDAAHESEVLKP
jgi:hypothetical protein